ncbi:Cof-type HAD-IIB family hydrolase [Niveibacterium sp. 24ML]|uniref:HAD-IIB family hydrolase n=1 Tax=Niveibacterium sp. 24ML TaxID=2985512 RepID=UPI00226D9989|nr:HAD family hydrolase [Niveibacterium sp. 24ML]MCX9157445.1 Cof-type HAD-IIB family hydrolase [Niveibacterium sp. 24ML]
MSTAALYVSDLDFTLLDSSGQLSATTRLALSSWLTDELLFTVASARAWTSIRDVLDGIALPLPAITNNGACVTHLAAGRHLDICSLPAPLAREVYRMLDEAALHPLAASTTGDADRLRFGKQANAGIAAYFADRTERGDPRLRSSEPPHAALDEQVLGLTVIAQSAEVQGAIAKLQTHFAGQLQWSHMTATMHPGFEWLSIGANGATKGDALLRLKVLAGLDNHHTVAYGDDLQDLSLLAAADHAVAVANAHPRVRDAAASLTARHDQDGVVRHIAQHSKRMLP